MHVRDWAGPEDGGLALCVHGLTRNAHDFDTLAGALSASHRVLAMDLPGRGKSEWLASADDYVMEQYGSDAAVVAGLGEGAGYDWIGTSLGGLLGIALAGMPESPIRRLVINDIAPEVPLGALRRVSSHIDASNVFENLTQAEEYFRTTLTGMGPLDEAGWEALTLSSVKQTGSGFEMRHDPGISHNFSNLWFVSYVTLWEQWQRIQCPVLVLRGSESDFLTPELVRRMKQTLSHMELLQFEDVGHVPALASADQVDAVCDWLRL